MKIVAEKGQVTSCSNKKMITITTKNIPFLIRPIIAEESPECKKISVNKP